MLLAVPHNVDGDGRAKRRPSPYPAGVAYTGQLQRACFKSLVWGYCLAEKHIKVLLVHLRGNMGKAMMLLQVRGDMFRRPWLHWHKL